MERTQRSANALTGAHLLRLAALGAGLALGGALVLYLGWKIPHPFLLQRQQRAELADLGRRLERARAQNRELAARAHVLSTPEGLRQEARKLNFVKPGERPLRIVVPPPPPAKPRVAPPRPPAAQRFYLSTKAALAAARRAGVRFVYGR